MNINSLNPFVRSAAIYEMPFKCSECKGLDSKIIYIISGEATLKLDGEKPAHVGTGSLIYVPAGAVYSIKSSFMLAGVITFDLDESHADITDRLAPIKKGDDAPDGAIHSETFAPFDKAMYTMDMEIDESVFLRLAELFIAREGYYRAQASAMLKTLLIRLAETKDASALPTRMVEGLGKHIKENIREEISNTEIGATFGYHPFYVSKLIKDRKGQTLRQYVISYRLRLAKSYLETTKKSINEIADECGFTDASYFTKTFRTAFGMTPKEYRNALSEDCI